jgi:hypothetical protein
VLRVYDPLTGIVAPVVATAGAVPTAQPLITMYRDRLFLSGADHVFYACRTSDVSDWDFTDEMTDSNRPVAGQLAHAGRIGSKPKAMIPFKDKALAFASENELWVLRGDVVDGTVVNVSSDIGVIAPNAWAVTPDGLMAFLSNDGVYVWSVGDSDRPQPFSDERVPEELKNVSYTTNTINMAYDPIGKGFHLFITPTTGNGVHWWLDIDNKAMWPVVVPATQQPVAAVRWVTSGLAETVVGCKDGYLRKFSAAQTTDDGTNISSHVLLGPFRIAAADDTDALLAEIHGILADNSGATTWRVIVGESAEAVADIGKAGIEAVLAGNSVVGVAASGTWADKRNKVERPRARGPWAMVWIASTAQWSYEAVAIVSRQLGRMR